MSIKVTLPWPALSLRQCWQYNVTVSMPSSRRACRWVVLLEQPGAYLSIARSQ